MSKKKKNTTINAYQQALLRGLNASLSSNALDTIEEFMREYRLLRKNLGIEEGDPLRPSRITERFNYISSSRDIWASAIKYLTLGLWYENRTCFRLDADAVAQANGMHLEQLHANSKKFFGVLNRPIYVEFPGENGKQAFFAGVTNIPPIYDEDYKAALKELDKDNAWTAYVLFIIDASENAATKTMMVFSLCDSIAEDISRLITRNVWNATQRQMLLVLAYLCYVLGAYDALNNEVFPVNRSGANVFAVKPIPSQDCVIDYANSTSWIRHGLARYFGYLSRATFTGVLNECPEPELPIDVGEDNSLSNMAVVGLKTLAARNWEKTKIVFQYSEKTILKAWEERDMLIQQQPELFRYFPHKWIALNNTATGGISLCGIVPMEKKDEVVDGLAVIAYDIVEEGASLMAADSDEVAASVSSQRILDQLGDAALVVLHILAILKTKTEKLLEEQKDPKPWTIRVYEKADAVKKIADLYTDDYYAFNLNEVTPRTIKRIPQEQAVHMAGWTQRPHERRAHPHRYWVGHGEDRHIITHWLEPMQIHGDKKKPAVVHKIETGKTKDD